MLIRLICGSRQRISSTRSTGTAAPTSPRSLSRRPRYKTLPRSASALPSQPLPQKVAIVGIIRDKADQVPQLIRNAALDIENEQKLLEKLKIYIGCYFVLVQLFEKYDRQI